MPATPSSARARQASTDQPAALSTADRLRSKLYSFSMKRASASRSSCCSSASEKFMAASPDGSQVQDQLRDDVALDLVRSAVDARLAHVEVARRSPIIDGQRPRPRHVER